MQRVRLVGFITERATVRQILEHVGGPKTASAIALACSPPLAIKITQPLAAPVFEATSELGFYRKANLTAEAAHDLWAPRGCGCRASSGVGVY